MHRRGHRLAGNHARCHFFDFVGQLGIDRPFAVNRLPQRIDHAPEQFFAHRHFEDAPRGLHGVALGNLFVITQHHRADGIAFQVQRKAIDLTGKFNHLALHDIGQTVNADDTVGYRNNRAFVARFRRQLQILNPALDQITDFRGV